MNEGFIIQVDQGKKHDELNEILMLSHIRTENYHRN